MPGMVAAVYTMVLMFCGRHPKTSLAAALVLLLFTSADLLGDVGSFSVCSSDSSVELHEYLPHDGEDHPEIPFGESPSHPEQHHIDDCFCCSHCVQHATEFVLFPVESTFVVPGGNRILGLPVFVEELFRPPQAS